MSTDRLQANDVSKHFVPVQKCWMDDSDSAACVLIHGWTGEFSRNREDLFRADLCFER